MPTKQIDKLTIGFIADLLYYNNLIDSPTLDRIYDCRTPKDLGDVIEWLSSQEVFAGSGGGVRR